MDGIEQRNNGHHGHLRALAATLAGAAELPAITAELEREGVESFCASYRELLGCIDQRASVLRTRAGVPPREVAA